MVRFRQEYEYAEQVDGMHFQHPNGTIQNGNEGFVWPIYGHFQHLNGTIQNRRLLSD